MCFSSNKSIKGRNKSHCNPFKYKSDGGRLDVEMITAPFSNRPVKSRRRINASATSVTWNSSKHSMIDDGL